MTLFPALPPRPPTGSVFPSVKWNENGPYSCASHAAVPVMDATWRPVTLWIDSGPCRPVTEKIQVLHPALSPDTST